MNGAAQSLFAKTVQIAPSFGALPDWAKKLIRYGELYVKAPQGSVNVPDRLLPAEVVR